MGKEQLKAQGDYNDLLKESQTLLKKIDNTYDSIEARIESMSKSSINVKEIERELSKAKTIQFKSAKKLSELTSDMSKKQKEDVVKYLQTQQKAQEARKKGLDDEADGYEEMLKYQAEGMNTTQLSAIQVKVANQIAKESVEFAKRKLAQEKEYRDNVGFTGAAMGLLADKIGLGASYQEDLVEKTKELAKFGQKLTFGDKLKALGSLAVGAFKEMLKDPLAMIAAYKAVSAGLDKVGQAAAKTGNFVKGLSADSAEVVSGLAAPVADLVGNIPLVGGLLSGMISGFASVLDLVIGVEDKIVKAGRALGMNRAEAMAMNKEFAEMSMQNGDIFATSKALMEMQVSLGEQLGVNNRLTEEQLTTNIHLKDLMGLDVQTMGDLTMAGKIAGKSQEGIVKSVLAQVQGLKAATGISLNQKQILKEASSLSGVLGLQFAKYPEKLTKSLVTTKALGMELKELDGIADSFLDFESSISNEMEAQLLTGKNINLSKARELFLNNDLAGAAMEINSQVGSSAEFLNLNRIKAESLAKAFGMSRDQMGDMLKKQEYLGKLGAKDTDNAREQLRLGLAKYKNQEALSAALGEEAYNSLVTASTQEKMVGFIEKVKSSLVDFLEHSGLIDKIRSFMEYLSEPKNVRAIIEKAKNFMADAVEFIGTAAYNIINALDYVAFGKIPNDFIESIKSGAQSMGASIRSMGVGGMGGGAESVGGNAAASIVASSTPAAPQGFANPNGVRVTENGKSYLIVVDRVTGKQMKKEITANESADVAVMHD
jgi:hypothetical protein